MGDGMHEGHRERLRRQFLERGDAGLFDHQLLELLLTYSIPRKDTNPLAHALLGRYGSLVNVLYADPFELMRQEGVGESTAVLLSLAGKLGLHAQYAPPEGAQVINSADAVPVCRALVGHCKSEALYLISLNHAHRVLHTDCISNGTPTETFIHTRLVVECALRHGATGVILCHNHPSGNAKASAEDVKSTTRVARALEPLGIALHDHIIIGGKHAYSMFLDTMLSGGEGEQDAAIAAERNKQDRE
ncbi:MAG: hypothetical protein LBN26_03965 [Christensenellaceae bacterium]|jgi:DNA repair protein RadC|nr:hypothetical protein [Christensenellaceae bacterium]